MTEEKKNIPQWIMQTWKLSYKVPEIWDASPASIKQWMPHWQYSLCSDQDNRKFVRRWFPQYLSMYDGFRYNIQRADVIRYMWLYIHGGVYMDLDYKLLRSLDPLFATNQAEIYFIQSTNYKRWITNSFMAAKPGSKFWLVLLEEIYKRAQTPQLWWHLSRHAQIMLISGPAVLTYVLEELTNVPFMIFPAQLINPIATVEAGELGEAGKAGEAGETPYFLQPLAGGSWAGLDTMAINFFARQWRQVILGGIFVFIVLWLFRQRNFRP